MGAQPTRDVEAAPGIHCVVARCCARVPRGRPGLAEDRVRRLGIAPPVHAAAAKRRAEQNDRDAARTGFQSGVDTFEAPHDQAAGLASEGGTETRRCSSCDEAGGDVVRARERCAPVLGAAPDRLGSAILQALHLERAQRRRRVVRHDDRVWQRCFDLHVNQPVSRIP